MNFTIKDVENQVRLKILDTYEDNYRFAATEIFNAIRDGLRLIRSKRPESRYVNCLLTDKMLLINNEEADFIIPESFPATIGETTYTLEQYRGFTINMEERWMEAVVNYTIHQMYLKDDTDTANADLAKTYYAKFTESINS